jgi:uncharacterized coiled-coil DUF342 family protein
MDNIDKLYDDADSEYAAKIAALNLKFDEIKKKRDAYLVGLLDKEANAGGLQIKLENNLADMP